MASLVTSSSATMTSLEIANLVESRHDAVKKSIERLAERGVIEFPPTAEIPTQTKPTTVYIFDLAHKRDSYIVVAQLSPEFTARLVDRWQELESQVAAQPPALNPANLSRLQLIEIAMQAEQERLALEHQVVEMQPKVAALDRIATASDGAMCLTNTAKALQLPPQRLIRGMSAHKWIYKRVGNKNWTAYQERIQQGLLEHKVNTVPRDDGSEKVVEQVLVTPKGLTRLASLFGIDPVGGAA